MSCGRHIADVPLLKGHEPPKCRYNSQFELAFNLKAANPFGITVSPTLLARTD